MQTLKLSFSKQIQIIVSNEGIASLMLKVSEEIRDQIQPGNEFYIGDGLYFYGKDGSNKEYVRTPSKQIVFFDPSEETAGSLREFIRVIKSPKSLFGKFDELLK